jgi:guanosine-3',5'-bis(diphosphate) 3'-pyrophosphohydrolase
VVSSKARTAIRHFLKRLEHEDAVDLGHRMLDRALEARESSLDRVPQRSSTSTWPSIATAASRSCWQISRWATACPAQVAQVLAPGGAVAAAAKSGAVGGEEILITGSERGVLSFARCCYPIPGDEIMGYLTSGKGVVVHRADCRNAA